jgi:nitrite reductase/ring-hydroxylating ferredoxin subunit
MIKQLEKVNQFFLKLLFQVIKAKLNLVFFKSSSSIQAQPSAEIIWDKNGELIGDDSSFRIDYYGNGRATLYIPEAFLDDQGYYTCTATNSYGTCRTTSRLTIDCKYSMILFVCFFYDFKFDLATGERISPKRRQLDTSETVFYQQGPTQTLETYRIYSQPTTVTQVTEETQVYQIPSHHQQQQQENEITYSIQETQPKFQPVSFLVSSNQDDIRTRTTITTEEEDLALVTTPYEIFGTQLHTRPNQSVVSPYGDQTSTTTTTTTMYSQQQQQQQPRNTTGLIATLAKQPGPNLTQYQQPFSQERDRVQTESETSTVHYTHSPQQHQETTTSYITTRPDFTKVTI